MQTQSDFLDLHWQYGAQIHVETAKVLVEALRAKTTMTTGHSLYLRLFAECVNSLELVGAWGWAIRGRGGQALFLDRLLAYPADAPARFFTNVHRCRSKSILRLLKLPSERRTLAAMRFGFDGWSEKDCRNALAECFVSLEQSAVHYHAENEIFRTTYNRAKHGATLMRQSGLTPREFYVVAPHLVRVGKRDRNRYDLVKFTVNAAMIQPLERRIEVNGGTIRFLAGLVRALEQAGRL